MTLTGKTEEQNFKDKPFLLYFDVQKKENIGNTNIHNKNL